MNSIIVKKLSDRDIKKFVNSLFLTGNEDISPGKSSQNNELCYNIDLKFNSLNELICNYLIRENLLGKASSNNKSELLEHYQRRFFNTHTEHDKILLSNKKGFNPGLFSASSLQIKPSNFIYISASFEKLTTYFFNIYPEDIFSTHKTIHQVNEPMLLRQLALMQEGSYIKLYVFSNQKLCFESHPQVIKKTNEHYSFFDPNYGEYTHLDVSELCMKINAVMRGHNGTKMVFLDGHKYLAHLQTLQLFSRQECL